MAEKMDTRAIGLEAGLHFIRWLTGAENLHYGLWEGLEPNAGNLRRAQEAYTERLFGHLPERSGLRILDIGGGAGETAKRLLALGHEVEIVVPSALLAARCRANAPGARVHQCRFEEFQGAGPFDLCLFSESFQYVALDQGLSRAVALLAPEGEILIADCFRSEGYHSAPPGPRPGGGHPVAAFREELSRQPLRLLAEEDITAAVAPSIDLEQGLFNVIGEALSMVDAALARSRPKSRWLIQRALGLWMKPERRARLWQRLTGNARNAEAFMAFNQYLILRLQRQES